MIVVGIDLSLTSTGIATVHTHLTDKPAQLMRVQTKGSAGATLRQRRERLTSIVEHIYDQASYADLAVIEGPAFSRSNPGMHDRSGLWWLVVERLTDAGFIEVVEVAPSARAKYATGKGNAGKDQVLAAVVRRYPSVEVSGNDEADALVLAAMGARAVGHPIDDLPQAHLTGMAKVAWPTRLTGAAA